MLKAVFPVGSLLGAVLIVLGFAADGLQAADKLPVAVINMDQVFKTYKPLLDELAPIREAVVELEKTVQLRTAELETIGAQGRKATPGSAEFNKLQQQFAKLQGELQKFVTDERTALQKREAAAYLKMYRDLDEAVKTYAKANGIQLVLRQQDSSLDENQPLQELPKTLGRGILYEDGLDITADILKALEAKAKATPTER